MSVDPSSVIVAIGSAVSAAVLGLDVPGTAEEPVAVFADSVEQGSARLGAQLDELLGTLPADFRVPAQQVVAETHARLTATIDGHLPDPPDTADGPDIDSSPAEGGAPVAAGPAARPNSWGIDSGAATVASSSRPPVVLPAFPAAIPGTTAAPIGAIAVFAPWLIQAGSICAGITAPVLAALYSVENGVRYGPGAPVSPAGARGPGQFMPGTWDAYGSDADGDGKADTLGLADAVMASGHLLCDNWSHIESWKLAGRVAGDTLDLTLAAYNAGLGAVLRSGGMPARLPDYETQTKPYVARILATRPTFERILAPFVSLGPLAPTGTAERVIDEAFRYLGLPYVWGGGNIDGPSSVGFDCSGLTSFAVHAATGITLPRTSETQWQVGTEVPLAQALPGDLVFGNRQTAGPGQVGIYIGGGRMVHAPTTGDVVRVGDVFPDMRARRVV